MKWNARMRSQKGNGVRTHIASAKNARRKNAQRANHIDARGAVCGAPPKPFPAGIEIRVGLFPVCVPCVKKHGNVLCARKSNPNNISTSLPGERACPCVGSVCSVSPKAVAAGNVQPVAKKKLLQSFLPLPRGVPLARTESKCATRAAPKRSKTEFANARRKQP